jgi:hypothetical protein
MNISIKSLEQKVALLASQLESEGFEIIEIDTVKLGNYMPSYVSLMIESASGVPFYFKILANGYDATGSEIETVRGWKVAKSEILNRIATA